ncbi:uncharacterized protein BCR38DRAFT_237065 [Pseudomassariella vexata]|uniref:Uncharacterized protein n=1 Tax=Pseudomassariella vexata TaxID=1141098 RepID=A0A1Y2DT35_9PEZI|nr:uncharacterized protein BCR38DRAFT_237065 [Pseudomassariella vexata]ORY62314.1 hypothetical protein BCR38DRAFT_237065 [Pseudomassariella vexata]
MPSARMLSSKFQLRKCYRCSLLLAKWQVSDESSSRHCYPGYPILPSLHHALTIGHRHRLEQCQVVPNAISRVCRQENCSVIVCIRANLSLPVTTWLQTPRFLLFSHQLKMRTLLPDYKLDAGVSIPTIASNWTLASITRGSSVEGRAPPKAKIETGGYAATLMHTQLGPLARQTVGLCEPILFHAHDTRSIISYSSQL